MPSSFAAAFPCLAFAAAVTVLLMRITSSSVAASSSSSSAVVDGHRRVRMKTAQCRASCLGKFPSGQSDTVNDLPHCHNTPDCTMCWQTCDLLLSNYDVWGPMCSADNICFPGCQVACKFRQDGPTDSAISRGKFLEPARLVYDSREDIVRVEWVRPVSMSGSRQPGALVYVILLGGLLDTQRWEEVVQTPYLNATVSRGLLKQSSSIRVVALGPWGTFAQLDVPTDNGEDKVSLKDGPNAVRGARARHWMPQLAALRPAASKTTSAVEALVSWMAPSQLSDHGDAKYEVTWRVLDGAMDVTGHLYTSRESATLTLWPDVTYAVHIRCFGSNSERALATSEALVIDTRDTAGPKTQALTQHCPGCLRMEIAAGCAAGLSILLLVCVVALLITKTRSSRRQDHARHQTQGARQEIRGVPDRAAHRMHMDAIKPSRLEFPGVVLPVQADVHNAVQPSGPMSPMGESREDLLDDDQSRSNYFVFDFPSDRVPRA
ncbi:uncharacterized protein LOC135397332 [Ornithodoros turicata]|uniref:uncharacterized protein LOC135397332 n=1 Tax=Ornithodoros turicata TaxID=34597 RepID=UPI0031389C89